MRIQKTMNKSKDRKYERFHVYIPTRVLYALGWSEGDDLDFDIQSNRLILRKVDDASAITTTRKRGVAFPTKEMRRIDSKVAKLHPQGLLDREIAEQIGVSISTVSRARNRLGLEPNGPKRLRGRRRWDDREAEILHAEGLMDHEIAEPLGVSRETITKWRNSKGLPRNGRPGPKPGAGR